MSGWLKVRCVAGYDGGLPQTFILEALDPISGRVRFNSTVNESGMSFLQIDFSQVTLLKTYRFRRGLRWHVPISLLF